METGRRGFLKGLLGASVVPITSEASTKEVSIKSRYVTKSQMIKIMLSSVPITYKHRGGPTDFLPAETISDKESLEKDFKKMTRNELVVHAKEFFGITF